MPMSITGRPDEKQSMDTIHAALDAGMTFIDTADVYCMDHADYGHNERLIAKALKGRREKIVVGTKGGLRRPEGRWTCDPRPEKLKAACDASLKALGVEQIQLYQLHSPDPSVPFAESMGALADLRKAGKIQLVGLSNVTAGQIREALKIVPVATVQNRFSPFFREVETNGVLKVCAELGLGFLAYSPVGGGRLHKKLSAHAETGRVAKRRGLTPHQVILAWVLSRSPAVIPIPGASRPESARGSAAVAEAALSPADLSEITAAVFPTA
jgi:aryl-alcohol dehydrogenase-like predicted oxidoreductase